MCGVAEAQVAVGRSLVHSRAYTCGRGLGEDIESQVGSAAAHV